MQGSLNIRLRASWYAYDNYIPAPMFPIINYAYKLFLNKIIHAAT